MITKISIVNIATIYSFFSLQWKILRYTLIHSLGYVRLLWPHGLKHARLPHPSLSPGLCSNSYPLSQWCHPTISSSVVPFSTCPQSFPASGSLPMSQFFVSDGQSIGASTSVLPINIQGWFPLGLTGLISLLSKGLSRAFSSTSLKASILQLSGFFMVQLSHWTIHDYWKNHSFDYIDCCWQSNASAF